MPMPPPFIIYFHAFRLLAADIFAADTLALSLIFARLLLILRHAPMSFRCLRRYALR